MGLHKVTVDFRLTSNCSKQRWIMKSKITTVFDGPYAKYILSNYFSPNPTQRTKRWRPSTTCAAETFAVLAQSQLHLHLQARCASFSGIVEETLAIVPLED